MSDDLNPEIQEDTDVDTSWETLLDEPVNEPEVEEIAVEVEDVISSPEPVEDTTPALAPVAGGAMGSAKVATKKKAAPKPKKSSKKDEEPAPEKVAVFSTRNVTWSGVGKVYRGYNIVTKEQSEQWLKRDHIRLATPDEVAKEFGN